VPWITTIGLDVPRNLFFRRMASTAQGKMSIRRQLKRRYAPAFFQKLQACLVGMSGLLVGARATSAITRVQCLAARPFPSCVQNRYPRARDDGRGPRFPRASRANRYSHAEVEAGLIVLSSTPMAVGTMQGLTVRKSKSSRSNALTVSPYRLGGVLDSRLEERARYHLARTLDFTARGTKRLVARCRLHIP
jgi:hypothetical protein